MAKSDILFDRTRHIKDPVWVSVEMALRQRLEQLKKHDPDDELEVAQIRYNGLLAGDVHIEPAADTSTGHRVCISSRKTGFMRVDIPVYPLELPEIMAGLKESVTRVPTIHAVLGLFLEKHPDIKYVHCSENGRLYSFVPGVDLVKETKDLIGDIFFDQVSVEEFNYEGNVPSDYSNCTITLGDKSLHGGKGEIYLISYAFAEDLVTDDRISISLVETPEPLQFKESNTYLPGNKFDIKVSGGNEKTHTPVVIESLDWDQPTVHQHETELMQNADGSYLLRFSGWFGTADQFDALQGTLVLSTTRLSDGKKILSNVLQLKDVIAIYQTSRFEIRDCWWNRGTKDFVFKLFDRCTEALVQDKKWEIKMGSTVIPADKVQLTGDGYLVIEQVKELGVAPVVLTQVRRHADSKLEVAPDHTGVTVTELSTKLTGTWIHTSYSHQYTGLDLPVASFDWDGSLTHSSGLIDIGKVTSFQYDENTGILTVQMATVKPTYPNDADYMWAWEANAGPATDLSYSGNMHLAGADTWMVVAPPIVEHDWAAGNINITVELKNPDGSFPEHGDWTDDPVITGPVDMELRGWEYDPSTGKLLIVIKTDIPDEGGRITVDVTVIDGKGHFGEIKVDEQLPAKSTMTVNFVNATLDLISATPTLTWKYQVMSKIGPGAYELAQMDMPAKVATNTVGGTLQAIDQGFDKTTQTGYVTFEIVTSTNQEMHYNLEGVITADGSKEPVSWTFSQAPTLGYYVTASTAVLKNGTIIQKLKVNNKEGTKAARANIIDLTTLVGVDLADQYPRDQSFDVATQTHTFTVGVINIENQVQDYRLGGEIFIDDTPIPFMVVHAINGLVPATAKAYMEGSRACVELRMMYNSQESDVDLTGTLVSLTDKAAIPNFTLVRKPGTTTRWIYSAEVIPPTVKKNYDFVVDLSYNTGLVDQMVNVTVQHKERVTQSYEQAGSVVPIPDTSSILDTGELVSGVNPAGILTTKFTVKLKDGTFPKSCKVKVPLENLTYAVGAPALTYENYDPATGTLTLSGKVYLNYNDDRSYTIVGTVESFSETSIQAARFVGGHLEPRHRKLVITKLSESTNLNRTQVTVNYQASHEDGILPLPVTMAKPFSAVTPTDTIVGYTPYQDDYDPATGLGSFTFEITPKTDLEIATTFTTSFTSPNLIPVNGFRFTSKITADTSFKATQNLAQYTESTGMMRMEYLIKNAANEHPASCTMGDLSSAMNTLDDTYTPTSEGYDPATGIFFYTIPVVKGTVPGQTLAYRLIGNLLIPGSPFIRVTFNASAYKYVLTAAAPTIENLGTPSVNTRQFISVVRDGVAGNVRTIVAENLACVKKDPARPATQSMETDGRLGIYMPITAPELTKRTYYTTTGEIVITTPENMKLRLPFTGNATAFLTPGSGQVDNSLQSMTLVGGVMTVVLKSYWTSSAGKAVYGGKLQLPMSAAYNAVPADPKNPTSQSWDDNTSTFTFTFNVSPPTAGNGGYYLFRGRLDYPEYSGYVSDEFEVSKTFPVT